MAEQVLKVKCPFCEGSGELTRSEVAEKLTTPEPRKRLDARIAEILENVELAGAGRGPQARNFEKEVHEWNPQLPIWRRSPKE
ncbi:MAG: hypothetical protein HY233_00565 [Acidobacteriales bacterium]|nr:hypothetical protein [Candidatus Koribacter versatilis]MBI3644452.1 hypothetical protein [Terriglobales bacterium]